MFMRDTSFQRVGKSQIINSGVQLQLPSRCTGPWELLVIYFTSYHNYCGLRDPRAISRDKELYPDPERFLPERFLQEGKQRQLDPAVAGAFGFGRRYTFSFTVAIKFVTNYTRICPGRHLAIHSVWLAMAYTLTMYAISPATDENGAKVELKRENTSGLTVYVFYKCLPFGLSLSFFFFI
jgi:hypothetical protein